MLSTMISGVERVRDGLWVTSLPAAALTSLGRPQSEEAGPNVLFVPASKFNEVTGTLEFAHGSARLVNLGTLAETIIASAGRAETAAATSVASVAKSGDRALIRESESVGEPVAGLVTGLLDAVRALDPGGEFVRFGTRRFINQSDNFITIIPQPRARDVRVVVRGSPSEFSGSLLAVKKDQNGYSTFKVANVKDLGQAISLLSRVRRKR